MRTTIYLDATRKYYRSLPTLICCLVVSAIAAGQAVDLTLFYVTYEKPPTAVFGTPAPNLYDSYPVDWGSSRPQVRSLGPAGATEPYAPAALGSMNLVSDDVSAWLRTYVSSADGPLSVYRRVSLGPLGGPCMFLSSGYPDPLPTKIRAGTAKVMSAIVFGVPLYPASTCAQGGSTIPGASSSWPVNDRLAFGAPIRRTTISGHEYEASPMVMQRNGVPWMTYYFAYRIGIAGGESNWVESSRSAFAADFPKFPSSAENFELTTLPPPIIEGEVVEFVNAKVSPASVGGHYFYASSAEDKAALDASDDWIRTGRQFKSGGYVPVCRFLYKAPGSSTGTHFFTAKADECAQFKTMPGFTYEGTPFRASLPAAPVANVAADDPTRCPPKTVPLYRFFNNPAAGSYLPNHRYLTNRAAGQVTGYAGPGKPAQTWADEGIALCVAG